MTNEEIWSAQQHRIFGYDDYVFKVTNQNFLEFVHPEDGAWVRVENDRGFDLSLIYIALPGGMNGVKMSLKMLERSPGLKMVYKIGYSGDALQHQALPAKSRIHLAKPFRKAELSSVPEKALRDGLSD